MVMQHVWLVNGEEVHRSNMVRGVEEGKTYTLGEKGKLKVTQIGDPGKPWFLGSDHRVHGVWVNA